MKMFNCLRNKINFYASTNKITQFCVDNSQLKVTAID